jgi:hypothetical protein
MRLKPGELRLVSPRNDDDEDTGEIPLDPPNEPYDTISPDRRRDKKPRRDEDRQRDATQSAIAGILGDVSQAVGHIDLASKSFVRIGKAHGIMAAIAFFLAAGLVGLFLLYRSDMREDQAAFLKSLGQLEAQRSKDREENKTEHQDLKRTQDYILERIRRR